MRRVMTMTSYRSLAACVALAMVAGALAVTLLRRIGPSLGPSLADDRLPRVLLGMVTPRRRPSFLVATWAYSFTPR